MFTFQVLCTTSFRVCQGGRQVMSSGVIFIETWPFVIDILLGEGLTTKQYITSIAHIGERTGLCETICSLRKRKPPG